MSRWLHEIEVRAGWAVAGGFLAYFAMVIKW